MPDVVVDVEMWIVHPDGAAQVEGYEPHHLSVAGDQGELALDHLDDIFEIGSRALEDRDGRDVHVAHIVFDMEERGVEWAQSVNAHSCLRS